MSLDRTQENDYVGPEVREGSKWLIVAEAPGEFEVLKGRPLVGPTGRIVDGLLNLTKLYRDHFDLANVVPWRPPENKMDVWTTSGDPRIKAGQEELELLIKAKDYTHIIGFGAVAMEFLTGKKKIYARRGSVYDCLHNDARVLCTVHPVNLFNEPKLANIIIGDVYKFNRLV